MYDNITVIIPSYKPDEKFISTVRKIKDRGFDDIITVDDGGGEKYEKYFVEAEKLGCTVLRHEVNRGKGAALKTAFRYYSEFRPDSAGVVTADADGQHLPDDIAAVAEKMTETGAIVIGSRDFDDPKVPRKSRLGNKITSAVFRLFFGMKIGDTQTGLRGIPTKYIDEITGVDGDRYEYETHMLYKICRDEMPFVEHGIETVYIDENSSSHFRAVRDSARVYSMLLKYLLASLCCTAADIALFCIFFTVFSSMLIHPALSALLASLAGRLVPAAVHYILARRIFSHWTRNTLGRYALTALGNIAAVAAVSAVCALLTDSLAVIAVLRTVAGLIMFPFTFRALHNKVFVPLHRT